MNAMPHARQQVGRNGDISGGGELIGHILHPVGHAEYPVNYQNYRGLVLGFRIRDEGLHRAAVVFHSDPLAVSTVARAQSCAHSTDAVKASTDRIRVIFPF